jgi:hypothetical protein
MLQTTDENAVINSQIPIVRLSGETAVADPVIQVPKLPKMLTQHIAHEISNSQVALCVSSAVESLLSLIECARMRLKTKAQ